MADVEQRLCVFARAPAAGKVKRRIAAELGEDEALRAHIELVEGTLTRLSGQRGWHTELWIADGRRDDPRVRDWCGRFGVTYRRQRGRDLGARMFHALMSCLGAGALPVLVGCDCPLIDAAYVTKAFAALGEADLVFGPAEDGGYGLVGTRTAAPKLFSDMRWGTSDVLAQTLGRAAEEALSVRLLRPIRDVDTAADWARYRRD